MLPKSIRPMLAIKADQPFDSEKYIFEPKFNGLRAIAFFENRRLRLQSRGLRDITQHFPELCGIINQVREDQIVLDGEIVVLDQGKANLQKVQSRIQITDPIKINFAARNWPATYLVFDLLYENGQSLMKKPLVFRKERLKILVENSERMKIVRFFEREGIKLFAKALSQGQEGVMAKRKDSFYLPGQRTKNWQKFKAKP